MHLEQHDWNLYVYVIDDEFHVGSTFDPLKDASHYPVKVGTSSQKKWRFQTRQQTYSYISTKHVKVVIIGIGGVVLHCDFHVKLSPGWAETESKMFLEHGALTPIFGDSRC